MLRDKKNTTINCISFLALCAVFVLVFNQDYILVWDALEYNTLSERFSEDSFFSFASYIKSLDINSSEPVRGYFFPLYIFVFKSVFFLFPNHIVFGIMSTVTFYLIMVALCYLFDAEYRFWKSTVAFVLLVIPFPDLFKIPLSDIYGTAFILFSLFFAKVAVSNVQNKTAISLLFVFLSGVFAGASYNTRTIYLFSIPIVMLFFYPFKKKLYAKFFVNIVVLIVGFVVCSVPQGFLNLYHSNSFNLMIDTTYLYQDMDLMLSQLVWGLTSVRYETFVGDFSIFPQPQLHFLDVTFIYNLEQIQQISSLRDYIAFAINNLGRYIVFYIKHAISLFSVFFGKTYLTDLNVLVAPYLISLTIMFLALFNSVRNIKALFLKKIGDITTTISVVLAVFIPIAAIIPGAVEGRFAVGGYILFVFYIAHIIDWKEFLAYAKKHKVICITAYIGFMMAMVLMGLYILSCMQYPEYPLSFKFW